MDYYAELMHARWVELGSLVGAPEDMTDSGALLEFVRAQDVPKLAAEVRRLRAIEERARTKLARLPIEETTAYERGQADALRHVLGGRA